ncbi:hypothetical protein ACS5NO_09220 [Larkinella sp. GY13]|uniref:hypothetical protein n=1 Tax=Larkinella sp. GY13 TaxID=3453720 RepID=UPI003EE86461
MKSIIIAIFMLILVTSYTVYKLNKADCKPCEDEHMYVMEACVPITSNVYRHLNCFCDGLQDWKRLSQIIRGLNYYRGIYGEKYPTSIFGTKDISCSDDELQVDVFEDEEVFLYIIQDTSKIVHAGALKALFINAILPSDHFINILDVGKENRTVTQNLKKTTVQYHLNYDEINSKSLIKFQQAIHHDSSYQKRFKNVEYQLVNKETRRHDASIRYEDFGERFYLDVF